MLDEFVFFFTEIRISEKKRNILLTYFEFEFECPKCF